MGHPHDVKLDKPKGKGTVSYGTIGRKPGKVSYGTIGLGAKVNLGQAGRPISHEERRRQVLFDSGIDIGEKK